MMAPQFICSDLNTDVLMRHNGPRLQELGVAIEGINLFQLFDTEHSNKECLILMGCLYPPTDWQEYLAILHQRYAGWKIKDAASRRAWYDTLCYEAVVAQMPRATVCSISRSVDLLRPCKTPAVVCPLTPVLGHTPKGVQLCNGRTTTRSLWRSVSDNAREP